MYIQDVKKSDTTKMSVKQLAAYIRMYVCVYVCMYIRMYVFMYVCVCVRARARVCVCIRHETQRGEWIPPRVRGDHARRLALDL